MKPEVTGPKLQASHSQMVVTVTPPTSCSAAVSSAEARELWRLDFTHFEANILHAFPTITSSGFTGNWLLLTNAADFSYLLKARWVFHTLKA
jgi:hypothetical protein